MRIGFAKDGILKVSNSAPQGPHNHELLTPEPSKNASSFQSTWRACAAERGSHTMSAVLFPCDKHRSAIPDADARVSS